MTDPLKQFNFTDDDFKLLVLGLDSIPSKDANKELMGTMLGMMIAKDGAEFKKMQDHIRSKHNPGTADIQKENIDILKGKVLMFKRYLQTIQALNETNTIINTDL